MAFMMKSTLQEEQEAGKPLIHVSHLAMNFVDTSTDALESRLIAK